MKIAEALALRADLQKRLEQLKQRLVKNARIQEGDAPEEDNRVAIELEKSAENNCADSAYQPDKRTIPIRRRNAFRRACKAGRFKNTL